MESRLPRFCEGGICNGRQFFACFFALAYSARRRGEIVGKNELQVSTVVTLYVKLHVPAVQCHFIFLTSDHTAVTLYQGHPKSEAAQTRTMWA